MWPLLLRELGRTNVGKHSLGEMLIFLYERIEMFCQTSFWQHVLNAGIFILLNSNNQEEGKGDLFCIWKYQQNHIPTPSENLS